MYDDVRAENEYAKRCLIRASRAVGGHDELTAPGRAGLLPPLGLAGVAGKTDEFHVTMGHHLDVAREAITWTQKLKIVARKRKIHKMSRTNTDIKKIKFIVPICPQPMWISIVSVESETSKNRTSLSVTAYLIIDKIRNFSMNHRRIVVIMFEQK